MYILNEGTKSLTEISETTFSENGLKERYDLQEWIDNNPEIISKELGKDEELLIIQKEFSNFDKTKERLDLLALDKKGNLVIIENKLDDSGKDVTWQALKYASYCSTLTKSQVVSIYQEYLDKKNLKIKAEEKISEHLGSENIEDVSINIKQIIILIARTFSPEVTSTVLWLREQGINIQCIKFIPYKFQDKVIIDIDKIIPISETEEFVIKLAKKDMEDKNISIAKSIYLSYWSKLLKYSESSNLNLYKDRTTSKESSLSAPTGISGVSYILSLLKDKIRIGLYINRSLPAENKKIFNALVKQKEKIQSRFGDGRTLEWESRDKASSIYYSNNQFNKDNSDNWDDAIKWHIEEIKKFEDSIKDELEKIKVEMRSK